MGSQAWAAPIPGKHANHNVRETVPLARALKVWEATLIRAALLTDALADGDPLHQSWVLVA
jgi:hypothetical protein